MNVLKEAIQKLRVHLGRDRIGISLLDAITSIANEQRKSNAALAESSAADRESVKTLRAQLHELQTQVARQTEELARQSALREAAQSRERAALSQMSKPEVLEKMDDPDLERRIHALCRNAQRRFKKLPVDRAGRSGRLYLEDFVKNYTYDEFAGLGMALAACAAMNMPIPGLIAERTYRTIRRSKDYDPNEDMDLLRFMQWFRDFIKADPIEAKIYDIIDLPKE